MTQGSIVENLPARPGPPSHHAVPARVCYTVLALQAVCAQPFWSATRLFAQTTQQSPGGGSSARMRVKLDGFDLSHTGGPPNQIGTGSHESPEPMPESAAPAPRPSSNQSAGAHVSCLSRRGLENAARPDQPTVLYAPASAKAFSLTPTFYWRADDAQTTYTFRVFTVGPRRKQIYSAKVPGAQFTYPANAHALAPGGTYAWSVEQAGASPGPAVEGLVTIVGGQERATLAERMVASSFSLGAQAKIFFDGRIWFDALDDYTRLIQQAPTPELYRQRSALYDQVPGTYPLADADIAKAPK